MVSEPSDPNGRILESTQEIEHIMTEQEIRELLKDNPAIVESLRKESADETRKQIAESMGVKPGHIDKTFAEAKKAQEELTERNRRDAIAKAITEATKDLAYGEHVNAEFVRAINAANPADVAAVAVLVEAKR